MANRFNGPEERAALRAADRRLRKGKRIEFSRHPLASPIVRREIAVPGIMLSDESVIALNWTCKQEIDRLSQNFAAQFACDFLFLGLKQTPVESYCGLEI